MSAALFGLGMEKLAGLGCTHAGIEPECERFIAQVSMHQALCTKQFNGIYFQFPAVCSQIEVLGSNAQNLASWQTWRLVEQVHGR